MLAKVIPQQKRYTSARALVDYALEPDEQRAAELAEGLPPDAAALVQYAARSGVESAGVTPALDAAGITDPLRQQRELARALDAIVQRVRAAGVAADQPLYHVVVTWQPGERPTDAQARQAFEHVLGALGMRDAAAFYVVHRDKEHHHVHAVVCKYHPNTLAYLGPPKRDYLMLDRAMREIELAQGWRHSPGPHVVENGTIRLLSARERKRAQHLAADRATGLPGLLAFAEHYNIRQRLEAAHDWQAVHAALQEHGVALQPKGSGYVLAAADERGKQRVIKLSELGIRSAAFQQRLGLYEPPQQQIQPRITLAAYQVACMRGNIPEQPRTGKRDPVLREQRRQQRAEARRELYERYREHVAQAPAQKRAALAALKAQQKRERQQLLDALRAARTQRFEALALAHGAEVARQLLAGQNAAALNALKTRHRAERETLLKQHSPSWRDFLEMRARLHQDPTAIAALRGIAYREKRKQKQREAGFEGEDLRDYPRDGVLLAGSISGEAQRWTLAQAHAEVSRDWTVITYRDDQGRERVRDAGQRIEVAGGPSDEDATIAALELAADRYGGEVLITGDAAFREYAARLAARRGIAVANLELQRVWHAERELLLELSNAHTMPSPSLNAKEVKHDR